VQAPGRASVLRVRAGLRQAMKATCAAGSHPLQLSGMAPAWICIIREYLFRHS
jgi:hypothetical protein